MKDRTLILEEYLFNEVKKENIRQIKKWAIQDVTPFEWMTYITEEVGELAEAISENEYRAGSTFSVVKEAIQVATLCLKIAEMYTFKGGRMP